MAHGLNPLLKRPQVTKTTESGAKTGIGSRRIFAPHFKLQVLDSYRNDADCKGNQRATARKYGIHRRQIQKWLQCENVLRNSVAGKIKGSTATAKPPLSPRDQQEIPPEARKCEIELALRGSSNAGRQRDDNCVDVRGASGPERGTYGIGLGHCFCSTDARVPALSPNYGPHSPTTAGGHYLQEAPASPLESNPAAVAPPFGSEAPWSPAVMSPLDYTVHSGTSPICTADPAAPIDLSLKNHQEAPACYAVPSPATANHILYPTTPVSPHHASAPTPDDRAMVNSAQNQPTMEVWDLSKKALKRKLEDGKSSPSNAQETKPVKLFKPYLDDIREESASKDLKTSRDSVIMQHKTFAPCCNTPYPPQDLDYFNNNNVVSSEYSYCYPDYRKTYQMYSYEESYMYPLHMCSYDEGASLVHPLPLRHNNQNYCVDFKLSKIECYYQDSAIVKEGHRGWIKSEVDYLSPKNETFRPIHAVR